jgi:hypothetical protein
MDTPQVQTERPKKKGAIAGNIAGVLFFIGVIALLLSVYARSPQQRETFGMIQGGAHLGALVSGIIGWRSLAGKIVTIILGACMLLAMLLFLVR